MIIRSMETTGQESSRGSSLFSVGNDILRVSGPFNCFMLGVNCGELTKLNHKGTKTQRMTPGSS